MIGKGADDSVSPVLVGGAVAVVPEWWVSVAFAAALFVACCGHTVTGRRASRRKCIRFIF